MICSPLNSVPADERNTSLRFVVFKLESLAQRGVAAVPAIRSFIGRNVDVDYRRSRIIQNGNGTDAECAANGGNNQTNDNNGGGNNRRNQSRRLRLVADLAVVEIIFAAAAPRFRNLQNLRTDWVSPPSLRLGLVGMLQEIGGPESEQALAEMLSSAPRAASKSPILTRRAGRNCARQISRTAACAAAKELLLNPPAVDDPDQLDHLSKSYLYGVLEILQGHFVCGLTRSRCSSARTDGWIRTRWIIFNDVLKDQSVSALYAAYQNSNLTNQFDKMNLGREILNYAGQNPQANQLFTDTLNNADLPPQVKAFTIIQLAGGGFGPFASDAPTDPQVISGRIALLNSVQSQFANDPTLSQAITLAENALQNGSTNPTARYAANFSRWSWIWRRRVSAEVNGGGGK